MHPHGDGLCLWRCATAGLHAHMQRWCEATWLRARFSGSVTSGQQCWDHPGLVLVVVRFKEGRRMALPNPTAVLETPQPTFIDIPLPTTEPGGGRYGVGQARERRPHNRVVSLESGFLSSWLGRVTGVKWPRRCPKLISRGMCWVRKTDLSSASGYLLALAAAKTALSRCHKEDMGTVPRPHSCASSRVPYLCVVLQDCGHWAFPFSDYRFSSGHRKNIRQKKSEDLDSTPALPPLRDLE